MSLMSLIASLKKMSPEERQRAIEAGKKDRDPKARIFFECLERELADPRTDPKTEST
jgi:hypothetical protein